MKKYIGLALWLLAFALPFRIAILETDDLLQPDGTINNIKGLIGFVVMIGLFFGGYALIDSAGPKPGAEDAHGH